MPRFTVDLAEGEGLRIFGPARVRVVSGLSMILGAELGPGEGVYVSSRRSYLLKGVKSSRVEIELMGRGKVEIPADGEEPLDEWVTIADSIIDSCPDGCVVAVMGPTDSGKTSFTALLANRSLLRGLPPAVIDADVGQADIGPPGFVSMSMPDSWVLWLRQLNPDAIRFVGSIEPGPVAGRILSSVASLVSLSKARGAANVFIDTDGWVTGWAALEYKADLARLARAHYVVVLGDHYLYSYLQRVVDAEVAFVRSPQVLAARSVEDRRELRSENYRRFLEGEERVIDLTKVKVQGGCLGMPPYENESIKAAVESQTGYKVKFMSKYPGGICIALDAPGAIDSQVIKSIQKRAGENEVIVVTRGTMKGVVSALTGPDGNDYPALLVDIDLDSLKATFKTKYMGEVKKVYFGRVRIDEEYREEARGRIWV